MSQMMAGLFIFFAGVFIELGAEYLLKRDRTKRNFTKIIGVLAIVFGIAWGGLSLVELFPVGPGSKNLKDVHIAVAIAYLSANDEIGIAQNRGTEIAQEVFGPTAKKLTGDDIRRTLHNTRDDIKGSEKVFEELTERKSSDVVAIIGPSYSKQACELKHKQMVDQAKIPIIGPSNTAPCVLENVNFSSRVSMGVEKFPVIGIAGAKKVAEQEGKKVNNVSIFHLKDNAFTEAEAVSFYEAAESYNYNIFGDTAYTEDPADIERQAIGLMDSSPVPDLVIISGLTQDGGGLITELREKGYTGLIVGGNGLNTPGITAHCALKCDGVIFAEAYNPNPMSANTDPEVKKLNQTFIDQYRAIVGQEVDPPQFAAQAFTAVQVVVESLAMINQETPVAEMKLNDVRIALNKILHGDRQHVFKTVLGEIKFDHKGDIQTANNTELVASRLIMDQETGSGRFEKILLRS